MKKLFVLITFAAFAIAAVLFHSCQKEENITPPAKQGILMLKAAYVDCLSQCIDLNIVPVVYYEKTDSQVVSWGGPNNDKFTKTVELIVYNTETDFVIKVMSTNGWSDLVIDGVSSWTDDPVAPNTWGTYTVALPEGWVACDDYNFHLQVAGKGPQAVFDVEYQLIGVCGCEIREETAFGGDSQGGGSAWWYYFDTEGNETQGIYAGQVLTDGTVTINGSTLVIDLGSWSLQAGDETVKIEGYDVIPDVKPPPGPFTYKGNTLTIQVEEFPYYIIHLDVEICE